MKAFSLFLVELNDGTTHAALTGDLQELLQQVKNTGRAGSMTLKIKVANGSKASGDVDRITIMAERKLELPKPEQPQDFFWLTDDAQPTRQHPRQHSLDLREAQDTRGGLRHTPLATPIQAFANSLSNTFAEPSFTNPDADGVIEFKEAK